MPLLERLPALRVPAFRRWVVGSFFSLVGSSLQIWAIFWQLDHLTHRPEAVGTVGLIRVFPLLVFGLLAGHVADTRERAKVLLVTQSTMGVLALALALLTFTGRVTPLAIYGIVLLDSVARAYDGPARQSIVVNLVPPEHYQNAASISGIAWRMSEVLGPILSGALIATLGATRGPGVAYLANALSFGTLLYAVLRLPYLAPKVARTKGAQAVFRSIRDGLDFLRGALVVRNAMWIDFWGTLVAGASALLPTFARAVLHVGPTQYGFLVASQGVGAALASAWLASRAAFASPGRIVIGMIAAFGLATVGVGLSPNLWVAILFLALVGATDMISTVQRQTIRQLAVPDAMRGRLSSIGMIFQVSGPQLGDWEAAEVAGAIGTRASFILGGLGALFAAAWYGLRGPALRDYEYEPQAASG